MASLLQGEMLEMDWMIRGYPKRPHCVQRPGSVSSTAATFPYDTQAGYSCSWCQNGISCMMHAGNFPSWYTNPTGPSHLVKGWLSGVDGQVDAYLPA